MQLDLTEHLADVRGVSDGVVAELQQDVREKGIHVRTSFESVV